MKRQHIKSWLTLFFLTVLLFANVAFAASANDSFSLSLLDTTYDGGFYKGVCGDGDFIYTACSTNGVRAYAG